MTGSISGHAALAWSLVLLLASCGNDAEPPPDGPATLTFTAAGHAVRLQVEVADDRDERARGLMRRTSLPEGRGMVFLFGGETTTGFWMKNTLIPLSIAFWGEDMRILAILDMEPCEAAPCPIYGPGVPYVGAVEANQGWFERNGVKVGDRVELRR